MTLPSTIIPIGLCQCGCGQKTRISNQTLTCRKYIKGTPRRYVAGHSTRRPVNKERLFVEVDGVQCALIPLNHGQFTIVDIGDYEWLSQWTWAAHDCRGTRFYAVRSPRSKAGGAQMGRLILGLKPGDSRVVDHINGNTLDNRRVNLRIATSSENSWNRGATRQNTSGYKGVHFKRHCGLWSARIRANRKEIHLGYFKNPVDAAKAYNRAATMMHGEFAKLNEVQQ